MYVHVFSDTCIISFCDSSNMTCHVNSGHLLDGSIKKAPPTRRTTHSISSMNKDSRLLFCVSLYHFCQRSSSGTQPNALHEQPCKSPAPQAVGMEPIKKKKQLHTTSCACLLMSRTKQAPVWPGYDSAYDVGWTLNMTIYWPIWLV